MFKSSILNEIGNIYSQGGNIIRFINELEQSKFNTKESILISYDYQAGSYVSLYKKKLNAYKNYISQLFNEINKLGKFNSILEAGVGEATTFMNVIEGIKIPHEGCYGFDISWSRLKVAKDFLLENQIKNQNLFVAELSNIPLCDKSIDVVYTSHSIEPNGGFEKPILEELFRVTKNYLILFEPDYELAGDEARKRMESHGYIKNLVSVANNLGYNVIKHELLPYSLNPLNPTSVIIIKKSDIQVNTKENIFQCPITKTELLNMKEILFSHQSKLMYPIIQGIPCLLDSQAILGCKYNSIKE